MANEPVLDSKTEAVALLSEALRILDGARLTLPAVHVEHALEILREMPSR